MYFGFFLHGKRYRKYVKEIKADEAKLREARAGGLAILTLSILIILFLITANIIV